MENVHLAAEALGGGVGQRGFANAGLAKKARIQGKVLLNAEIGKDGTVEKLEVVSGPSELKQSSLDAVRQWTYKPFLLNGEPVNVKTTITVIYTLAPLKK